jgi:hypothetical protein
MRELGSSVKEKHELHSRQRNFWFIKAVDHRKLATAANYTW